MEANAARAQAVRSHGSLPAAEPIVALASGQGSAAVSLLRVSGMEAAAVVSSLMDLSGGAFPAPRQAAVRSLRHPKTGALLDQVVLTYFAAPASYTGENVVEIGCHGNPLVVEHIISALIEAGARPARPGEFTERAFLNGKIDLTQAEAISQLIGATNERALSILQRQAEGALGTAIEGILQDVRSVLARLEAEIEFSERDADRAEPVDRSWLLRTLNEISTRLRGLAANVTRTKLLRDGAAVALLGRPNVGKSSLFNALLGEDRALVDSAPGTTRDFLEAPLLVSSSRLRLLDTAGLREAESEIENKGVARTKALLAKADLALFVLDASEPLRDEDLEVLRLVREAGCETLCILNKSDLPPALTESALAAAFEAEAFRVCSVLRLSSQSGEGIAGLHEELASWLTKATSCESLFLTTDRQAGLLTAAAEAAETAEQDFSRGVPIDLLNFPLRLVSDRLQMVLGRDGFESLGRADVEDVLSEIFRNFCIGK